MEDKKLKRTWTVAGLILVILVAIFLVIHQATRPRETINDYYKIPPKGAGRFDR